MKSAHTCRMLMHLTCRAQRMPQPMCYPGRHAEGLQCTLRRLCLGKRGKEARRVSVVLILAKLAARVQVMGHHGVGCHAVVVAEAGAIHKTTSGKVQRRACRAAFMAREISVVSPPPCPAGPPCWTLVVEFSSAALPVTPAAYGCIPTRQPALESAHLVISAGVSPMWVNTPGVKQMVYASL